MGSAPGFDDPIGMMLEFHEQVRRQIAHMRAIVGDLAAHDAASVQEMKRLAEEVVMQLGHRRILHERDEVESLLPRLARAAAEAGERDPALLREIEHMEREHREWEATWRPIQFWLWMVGVDNPLVTADDLSEACRAVEEHLMRHVEMEERVVYPAARRLLGAADLQAMGEEMRLRRQSFELFGPVRPLH